MASVIISHDVEDLDRWLGFGQERATLFREFSSAHRVYVQPDGKRVSLLIEDVDMDKLAAVIDSDRVRTLRASHGVVEPVVVAMLKDGAA